MTDAGSPVVVLCGPIGAGKSTASSILEQTFVVSSRSFVDEIWLPILRSRGIPPTRHNLQQLGIELLDRLGPTGVVDKLFEVLDSSVSYVIDDVRTPAVFDYIRSKRSRAVLVFVETSFHARFPRLQIRDGVATEAEQRDAELVRTETGIPELRKRADYVVQNDGHLEQYRSALISVGQQIGLAQR